MRACVRACVCVCVSVLCVHAAPINQCTLRTLQVTVMSRSLEQTRVQLEAKNTAANDKLQQMVAGQKNSETKRSAALDLQVRACVCVAIHNKFTICCITNQMGGFNHIRLPRSDIGYYILL